MININKKNISRKDNITVEFFFNHTAEKFGLQLLSDEVGMDRLITDQNLHRPGLALAGFVDLFSFNRVQIFGNTELQYLEQLSKEGRIKSLNRILEFEIPCFVITEDNHPPQELLDLANEHKIAVFGTPHSTTKISYYITDFLEDQFSERISIHGSFVDVYGVGMLFVGKSGIGKSEVALDLVERGHRLVADDVVIFTKKGEGILIGSGTDLVKHFMELRGIGIIDIRSMFGVRAIRYQKRLELIIEMETWNDDSDYTRTGLDGKSIDFSGVEIPYIKLPIVPGKNLTVVAEVIALNYLLKHYGYNAAKVLQQNLADKIKSKQTEITRTVNYFEHDFE